MFRFLNTQRRVEDDKLPGTIPGQFSKSPIHSTPGEAPAQLTGRTRMNKAGLVVTAELDDAINRCRHKVKKLAAECYKANRRFRDIEFDLLEDRERCLHGLSDATKYTPTDALRASQLFDDPHFFVEGATASDISQGKIGDCWFLSALAVAATANLMEKICVERDEKVGIYGFIFWRDAGWVEVIIDDLLFLRVPKWQELTDRERMLYKYDQDQYDKSARRGSKALYFSKSLTENETWVPLIEKAFAKLHGDYAALEGGFTNEAVEDLTGAVSTLMYVQDILDPDSFWTNELMQANLDRAFACFTPDSIQPGSEITPDSTNGLITGHAYSVIKAVEYKGKRFLKVRNPWGKYEWTGRWSDGSKEWSGEWLGALEALQYGFGNDGEFIMEYSDFLKTWDIVEKCRLFDENWAFSQLWLKVNCGDYPQPTNFGDVSFTFQLSQTSTAVIVLAQLDKRYFLALDSCYCFSLDFALFKPGETEPIATSGHNSLWDRSVNLEVDLEPGDYVVQVRIDRKLIKEKDAPIALNNLAATRKLAQKRAEQLRSSSIAANFNPSEYGPRMPLSSNIYTGLDLTTMEIVMHQLAEQHRMTKKESFRPLELPGGEHFNGVNGQTVPPSKQIPESSIPQNITQSTENEGPFQGNATQQKNGDESLARTDTIEQTTDEQLSAFEPEGSQANIDSPTSAISPSVPMVTSRPNTNDIQAPKPIHEGFHCDGCGGPIIGPRFHCMDVACWDYDLCENCERTGSHCKGHQFIEVVNPEDADKFRDQSNDTVDNNSVTVGLRIYTRKECTARIRGQLRHGEVIRRYLTMSKII